jgi:alkylation response protein AidB-like acyl-CoA dehydrogenase
VDFEISTEERALVDSVAAVLAHECPTALVRDVVENGRVPEQPWKSACELGWTAIDLPEAIGGLDLGFTALGLVVEQHGRHLAPGPFLASVTQFLPVVCEAGGPDARTRFAAPAGSGELRGALAVDHGRVTGDAPGAPVEARRVDDAWILEGRHAAVLDGDVADEIAVVARVAEGDGVGLFVVPAGAVRTRRRAAVDASRPVAEVAFDGVVVAADRVLGTPGACAGALSRALERATVAAALECVGACQTLLDTTLEHARSRHQFGQPIGAFQAVQHKCADLFVQVEKARATAYFALMAVAEDDPRRALATSMAKAAASDCQQLVCRDAIQIHGGIGYTWESDVQLFVKRAMTLEALFGTGRAHRQRIADRLEV